MKVFDLIFGRKKKITDEFFGEIISQRIRKEKLDKEYIWYINHKIPNAKEKSQIILEGNFNHPNHKQIEELKSILKNLTDLYHKMDLELEKINLNKISDQKLEVENWQDEYYLSAVYPLDGQKLEFDICFDPIDDENENLKLISFEYSNGKIKNMAFY